MARKSREDTLASRARIVGEAARLFRLRGYRGAGLAEIMRSAGLTVGTFYAHFPSKAALFSEAFRTGTIAARRRAMGPGEPTLRPDAWLRKFLTTYISRDHRDRRATGCPIPCLVSDLARVDPAARTALEKGILVYLGRSGSVKDEGRRLALFATAVGAVALSRAVNTREISDRILRAARRLALGRERE
jgi:TetR/AcrR family transcriptional repressor of nem operon